MRTTQVVIAHKMNQQPIAGSPESTSRLLETKPGRNLRHVPAVSTVQGGTRCLSAVYAQRLQPMNQKKHRWCPLYQRVGNASPLVALIPLTALVKRNEARGVGHRQ